MPSADKKIPLLVKLPPAKPRKDQEYNTVLSFGPDEEV